VDDRCAWLNSGYNAGVAWSRQEEDSLNDLVRNRLAGSGRGFESVRRSRRYQAALDGLCDSRLTRQRMDRLPLPERRPDKE
jgi:hypothetical protein